MSDLWSNSGNIVSKALLAGVIDGNTTTAWYETRYPYKMNLEGSDVWMQLDKVRDYKAAGEDYEPARLILSNDIKAGQLISNVVGDYTIPETEYKLANPVYVDILPGEEQKSTNAFKLTYVKDQNGTTWLSKSKYNDMGSKTVTSWIAPPMIMRTDGTPSDHFRVRVFTKHPSKADQKEIFITDGIKDIDGVKKPGWYFNYSNGMLIVEPTATFKNGNPLISPADYNDVWIVGYTYKGKTGGAGGGLSVFRKTLEFKKLNYILENGVYEIDSQMIPNGEKVTIVIKNGVDDIKLLDYSDKFGSIKLDVMTEPLPGQEPLFKGGNFTVTVRSADMSPAIIFSYDNSADPIMINHLLQKPYLKPTTALDDIDVPKKNSGTIDLLDVATDIYTVLNKKFGWKTPAASPLLPEGERGVEWNSYFEQIAPPTLDQGKATFTVRQVLPGYLRPKGYEILSQFQPEYYDFDLFHIPDGDDEKQVLVAGTNNKIMMTISRADVLNPPESPYTVFVIEDAASSYEIRYINNEWVWWKSKTVTRGI